MPGLIERFAQNVGPNPLPRFPAWMVVVGKVYPLLDCHIPLLETRECYAWQLFTHDAFSKLASHYRAPPAPYANFDFRGCVRFGFVESTSWQFSAPARAVHLPDEVLSALRDGQMYQLMQLAGWREIRIHEETGTCSFALGRDGSRYYSRPGSRWSSGMPEIAAPAAAAQGRETGGGTWTPPRPGKSILGHW